MQTTIFLHEAEDGENSYALSLPGDAEGAWRAQQGYGGKFKQVWSVDFVAGEAPSDRGVDWDQVLTRAIEAYSMSDPVITNYRWPMLAGAR